MTANPDKKDAASRVGLADLGDTPRPYQVRLSPAELEEAARRLDVPAVQRLEADFTLIKSGVLIHLTGKLWADLTRICVVTLDELPESVAADFALDFTTEPLPEVTGEEEVSIEDDEPEPLEADYLDLHDIAVQQLSLEMTQYPRKEGAEMPSSGKDDRNLSPFSILKPN
ncbi:MAG: DUF177 domain-containing protein [Aquisalinus sp.]|nr:DUF177 domain-containing protein [Aquisalinus sp.]